MSSDSAAVSTAFRVADRIRAAGPWEVYGERTRRFEVHLAGRTVEMVRGPIALEGYGLRVLRPHGEKIGTGFQASTDFSEEGIRDAVADAERVAVHSEFPAARVELPSGAGPSPHPVEIVDRKLWEDPMRAVDAYVAELLHGFEGRTEVVPSFGSVRATLTETTIANSSGLRVSYAQTSVDFEVAVKAFGGPEGRPPGEYWVNAATRQLDPARLGREIDDWCRYAKDVRRAVAPPTGDLPVVLPAGVLAGIIPQVVGVRFTGAARLRKIAPAEGETVGVPGLSLEDDGLYPWGPASGPVDAEGSTRTRHRIIDAGKVSGLLYDTMHGGAFDHPSTSSASRSYGAAGFSDWRRFVRPPRVASSTLSLLPGSGGSDAELIEQAGDGIWVQQLGWAVPDEISGAFGGEIRIGYRIRHGKLAEPVRGGTVGGVVLAPPGLPSLLSNIAAIGKTPELAEGLASPTLLVRPLVVAGAGPTSSGA